MTSVSLSIVVPAFNEAHELPNLLASLKPLLEDDACEVLVVDNGSTDATGTVASRAGARVLRIDRRPVGYGRNAGAAQIRGWLLAFLDADVTVTADWIEAVRSIVKGGGRPGIVSGDVYDVVERPSWIERYWFGAMYRRGTTRYINGGNLIMTREDFGRIGGFDEHLTSGEDVEFCERARGAGLSIVPDRSLRVRHAGYPSKGSAFIAREAWHGRADFRGFSAFMRSPVAILAAVFAAAHLVLLAGLLLANWTIAAIGAAVIVGSCLGSSMWKWRGESIRIRLMNGVIFYLYFAGRALAALRELQGRPA